MKPNFLRFPFQLSTAALLIGLALPWSASAIPLTSPFITFDGSHSTYNAQTNLFSTTLGGARGFTLDHPAPGPAIDIEGELFLEAIIDNNGQFHNGKVEWIANDGVNDNILFSGDIAQFNYQLIPNGGPPLFEFFLDTEISAPNLGLSPNAELKLFHWPMLPASILPTDLEMIDVWIKNPFMQNFIAIAYTTETLAPITTTNIDTIEIPEPSTVVLMGSGVLLLLWRQHNRRRA